MIKQLIISDNNKKSLILKRTILNLIQKNEKLKKEVVIVIGGDGFMLKTLKKIKKLANIFMELILEITVF